MGFECDQERMLFIVLKPNLYISCFFSFLFLFFWGFMGRKFCSLPNGFRTVSGSTSSLTDEYGQYSCKCMSNRGLICWVNDLYTSIYLFQSS